MSRTDRIFTPAVRGILFLMACFTAFGGAIRHAAAGIEPIELWSVQFDGPIIGPPEAYAGPGDASAILVTTATGTLFRVSKSGTIAWSYKAGDAIHASAASGDLDGDGVADIVSATVNGDVFALAASGSLMWEFPLEGTVSDRRSPMLVDLDGDGRMEVIATDDAGWVVAISGKGERLWRFTIDPFRASTPGAADLDGDGRPEIVFGTENGRVVCLTGEGRIKWLRALPGKYGRCGPTLGDLNGDGHPDVLVNDSFNTTQPKIYALDGLTGEILWSAPTQMWGYAGAALADADGDGRLDIFDADRSNTIFRFDASGNEVWRNQRPGGGIYHPSILADLDGEGHPEVIYNIRYAGWGILSDAGEVLFEAPSEASNATALATDLDGDGRPELVVPLTDKGKLVAYRFEKKGEGSAAPWPSFRGNPARTAEAHEGTKGRIASKRAEGTTASLKLSAKGPAAWGENQLSLHSDLTFPERRLAEISVRDSHGARTTHVFRAAKIEQPGFLPYTLDREGRSEVNLAIWDESAGNKIAKGTLRSRLRGLGAVEGEAERVDALLEESRSQIAPRSPQVAMYLAANKSANHSALEAFRSRARMIASTSDRDSLTHDMDGFRRKLLRDERVAAHLTKQSAGQPGPPLLIWEDLNPWDDTDPLDKLPGEPVSVSIAAPLYRSEMECRAVNLMNVSSESMTVQVRLPKEMQSWVELREVVAVPRHDGSWTPDALPRINEARTLTIPSGQVRQLWLNLKSKSLPAGLHTGKVELLIVGPRNERVTLSVTADILDLDLANAPPFMQCNWVRPTQFLDAGFPAETVREAIEFGLNVFTLSSPAFTADAHGEIAPPDFTALDRELALLDPSCFLLFGFSFSAPASLPVGGEAYLQAYGRALRSFAASMAHRGWPKEQWALYPVDEPGLFQGGRNTKEFVEASTLSKRAAPEIQVYADPAGGVTRENFAEAFAHGDVWAPEVGMMLRSPDLVDFFKSKGDKVWCYEAPGGAKNLRPLGFYRSQPWVAFSLGLTGAGYWIYFQQSGNDLWLSRDATEYGANYAAGGVLVLSRRWHATRDGIEDVRALAMLRDFTAKAEAQGRLPDLTREARQLLSDRISRAIAKPRSADDITRHLFDYDPDLNELRAIRAEAARLSLALR